MSEVAFASLPVFAPVVESSSLATMQPTAGVNINRHIRYYRKHRDKLLARRRAHYFNNLDSERERRRLQYAKNPKAAMDSHRRWVAKNPTVRKEIANKSRRITKLKLKCSAYEKLGHKCAHCSDDRIHVLSIDHVNGDGADHRREIGRDYRKLYNSVIEDSSGRFQLLCMNCQWIKRHSNGETKNRAYC